MNVSSRCWSPFHPNECVFSMNSKGVVSVVFIELKEMVVSKLRAFNSFTETRRMCSSFLRFWASVSGIMFLFW